MFLFCFIVYYIFLFSFNKLYHCIKVDQIRDSDEVISVVLTDAENVTAVAAENLAAIQGNVKSLGERLYHCIFQHYS